MHITVIRKFPSMCTLMYLRITCVLECFIVHFNSDINTTQYTVWQKSNETVFLLILNFLFYKSRLSPSK